jgi:hypothetical protein
MPNDLKDLQSRRETRHFGWRNDPLLILLVFRFVKAQKRNGSEIDGRQARAADGARLPRLRDSEMAPEALEIP